MAGRFDTSLLVVLAMAAVNRLVEDWVVGRRLLLLTGVVVVDSLFKSLMLPFSELEKTPLDSVPVDVAICSSLLLFSLTCLLLGDTRSNRLPSDDFILCQSGGLDIVVVTVFELILDNVRSLVTETDDTRALVLLVATTRELTSFLSPVCWTARAVGGRIALSLMELLEGTALLMRTGSELLGLLGFKGTATPTTARRLDIVSSSGREIVIYTSANKQHDKNALSTQHNAHTHNILLSICRTADSFFDTAVAAVLIIR